MDLQNDLSLVTRVAEFQDRGAFGLLVKKYQSPIRAFFLHQTLGNRQLSDDLAQDTFVKAYLHIKSFQGKSQFSTWLYRIAYNVWYDYQRGHKITQDLEGTQVVHAKTDQSQSALRMDLVKALGILSENERTCITLQMMDGMPIIKIAEVMDMAIGTVKSHLSRGKMKLASYLKQNGYDRKG